MPYKDKSDRNYKRENENYKSKPEQIKLRVERNAARRAMLKAGKVHKGDGKDVDHIDPLSKGGKNVTSNLRVVSASENRSYPRNPDHTIKSNRIKGKK